MIGSCKRVSDKKEKSGDSGIYFIFILKQTLISRKRTRVGCVSLCVPGE